MKTIFRLTVGLLLLSCSPLSAQFIIDSFDDVTSKACSEHHLTYVEGEEIYVTGVSSNSCEFTSFIMRIDAAGNELWNTLDAEQSLPLIRKIQKIDGALYAIGAVPEVGTNNFFSGDWLVLLRIDLQTGEVLWQTVYEGVEIEHGFLAVFGLESHSEEHIFVNFQQHEQSSTDWRIHGLLFNKVEGKIESVFRGPKSRFAVFANDGNGNIVLTHGSNPGQLTLITNADSDFSDTLWSVNIPEFVDGFEVADVFFAGPGRLYVAGAKGGLIEVDPLTGSVLWHHQIESKITYYQRRHKTIRWPYLYTFLSGSGRRLEFSTFMRVDLRNQEDALIRIVEFDGQRALFRSYYLDEQRNTVTLLGDHVVGEDEDRRTDLRVAQLDLADGSVVSQRQVRVSDEFAEFGLSPSAKVFVSEGNVRFFSTTNPDNASHVVAAQIEISPESQVAEVKAVYAGKLADYSYLVHSIPDGAGNILQLRQIGPDAVIVKLDAGMTTVWSTTLPRSTHRTTGAQLAINSSGNIGVASRMALDAYDGDCYSYYEDRGESRGFAAYAILEPVNGTLVKQYSPDVFLSSQRNIEFIAHKDAFYSLTRNNIKRSEPSIPFNIQKITPDSISTVEYPFADIFMVEVESNRFVSTADSLYVLGLVYFKKNLGKIHVLDPAINSFVESFDLDKVLAPSQVIVDGNSLIVFGGNSAPRAAGGNYKLRKFDLLSGDIIWEGKEQFAGENFHMHLSEDGNLYTAGVYGRSSGQVPRYSSVSSYDPVTGDVNWNHQFDTTPGLNEGLTATPAILAVDELRDRIYVHGAHLDLFDEFDHPIQEDTLRYLWTFDKGGKLLDSLNHAMLPDFITDIQVDFAAGVLFGGEKTLTHTCRRTGVISLFNGSISSVNTLAWAADALSIAPNPVDESCVLTFSGVQGVEYCIVVRDVLGRHAHRSFLRYSVNGLPLDLSGLTPGFYHVEVRGAGSSFQGTMVRR